MLNIPEGVKTLFKTDGILKNIRVVFPNGESRNVCNDKILKESLKFEESLSSREKVRFGLCESSTISFDCVGLDNVKGADIAVYIEIDVSSIIDTDAEVAAAAQYSSDVPFAFYRVPLGYFIIDECKRDAKMLKRKVKGYSDFSTLSFGVLTDYVMGMNQFDDTTIAFNVLNYILASNTINFRSVGFVFTPVNNYFDDTCNYHVAYQVGVSNNNPVYVEVGVTKVVRYSHSTFCFPSGDDVGYLISYHTKSGLEAEIAECVSHMRYSPTTQTFEKQTREAQTVLNNLCHFCPNFIWVRRGYGYQNYSGKNIVDDNFRVLESEYFIMPYWLEMPSEVTVRMYIDVSGQEIDVYTHTIEDIIDSEHISIALVDTGFDTTIDLKPVSTFPGGGNYTYYDAYSQLRAWDLLSDHTELLGCFGKIDRYGYFKTISFGEVIINGLYPLDTLYPAGNLYPMDPYPTVNAGDVAVETITDDDMISNWYEEYAIKFGGITCDYYCSELLDQEGNPRIVTYSESWDDSEESLLYEIKDNAIINNNSYTNVEIAALLQPLVNALKIFNFCPSNLQSVGLPYVESGDWLYTSMQDNHVVNLCLSRTLSGIQSMRDKVKSD